MATFAVCTNELLRLKSKRGLKVKRNGASLNTGSGASQFNLVEVQDSRRSNERTADAIGRPDALKYPEGWIRYEVGTAVTYANSVVTFP